MQTVKLAISGMSCSHCVRAVAGALQKVQGAQPNEVRLGSAEVSYDADRVSVQTIVDAVADAGYEAEVVG